VQEQSNLHWPTRHWSSPAEQELAPRLVVQYMHAGEVMSGVAEGAGALLTEDAELEYDEGNAVG